MVKDNSDSKRRNPLPSIYGLLSLISSKDAPSHRQDTKAFVVQLYSCGALAEMRNSRESPLIRINPTMGLYLAPVLHTELLRDQFMFVVLQTIK